MDVDCSALDNAPLDGEFVYVQGRGEAVGSSSGAPTLGNNMAMVWSNKDRSDLQATGRKRTPVVFLGDLHCTLELFDDDNTPAAGMVLALAQVSVSGINRYIVKPTTWDKTLADNSILVGQVIRKISADKIECVIWSCSRNSMDSTE